MDGIESYLHTTPHVSLVPWRDPDSVIQLPEASGMSRHLDLLIPRFGLLLLVGRRRVQHRVAGDGYLNVTAEKQRIELDLKKKTKKNCLAVEM